MKMSMTLESQSTHRVARVYLDISLGSGLAYSPLVHRILSWWVSANSFFSRASELACDLVELSSTLIFNWDLISSHPSCVLRPGILVRYMLRCAIPF